MTAVFAVDACRTPVGKIKGALASVRPDHLTAEVIKALLARNEWLDPARIDDVYWGAANQAGEDNRNVARMGVLLAGLPVEVPGATVNRLCGSGMEAIASAARAIAAGEADIMLAGGAESMTRAPFVLPRASEPFARESGVADTRLGWRLVSPLMQELYPPITLGETAENVAERYGVTRERQDEFALRSHQQAGAARDAGRFDDEIVPVPAPAGPVTQDEGIRPGLTLEELAAKRPAFRTGGTVTGGNSSPLNDGAAGLLLVSERAGRGGGVTPLARYEGTAAAGVHPDYMGIGPVPAMDKVLGRAGWDVGEPRPGRAQRGVRGPGRRRGGRAQARPGAGQRERRRDRHRPPARLLRCPDHDHAAARAAPPRRLPGRGRDVHRGRPGHRDPLAGALTGPVITAGRSTTTLRDPGAEAARERRPARGPCVDHGAHEPVTSAAEPAVGPAAECSDRLLGEREGDRSLLVHLRVQGLIVQRHRRPGLQEDACPLGLDHLVPGYRAVGQRHLEGRSALVLRHDAQAGVIRQFWLGGEVTDGRHGTVGQCEHELLLCSIGHVQLGDHYPVFTASLPM